MSRGELLVPATSRRVSLDRRALRRAGASSTWPAARDTAAPCWPAERSRGDRRRRQPRGATSTRAFATARPACASSGRSSRTSTTARPTTRSSSSRRSSTCTSRRRCSSGSPRCSRPAASPTSARRTGSRSRRRAPSAPATRGTCASTRRRSSRRSSSRRFGRVELLGLFHARKLRAARARDKAGWDRRAPGAPPHASSFYDWFVPAIDERDFALRAGPLDRSLDLLAVCRP